MTPIKCARCGQPMTKGEYKKMTNFELRAQVTVHRSAGKCQMAKSLANFDKHKTERDRVKE